jgi:hypothetical protein
MLLLRVGSTSRSIHEPHPLPLCQFATQEDRLTKLVIHCPLGKFDLGDQHGRHPLAAFHNCRSAGGGGEIRTLGGTLGGRIAVAFGV